MYFYTYFYNWQHEKKTDDAIFKLKKSISLTDIWEREI